MSTPTIPAGAAYMNATLWTGTGSAASITNTAGAYSFQPDFVWIKCRSNSTNHYWTDSVRGTTKQIYSNSTAAEGTSGNVLTAFNSNGFSLGTDAEINGSTRTYVGWNWKANGSAVTNTSGTITSSVNANTTAGFSVVTYTGNGTTSQTVGHGLGKTPKFIIVKSRSNGSWNWGTWHTSLTGSQPLLSINNTNAVNNLYNAFMPANNSSTVFGIGSEVTTNENGGTYVAYCWTDIAGFSQFGSWSGNTSSDGPFVYTGFRPKFILIKNSTGGYNWNVWDTSRNPINSGSTYWLYPNLAAVEDNNAQGTDFLSNGFKLRSTGADINGGTMIYAAFAENPFKYANAR